MTPSNICSTCDNPMLWEICDACGGKGYTDAHNVYPLRYKPAEMLMQCERCLGIGGWYMCPNCYNHPPAEARAGPTGFDRTASGYASSTPAGTPATPLAGRQRVRQRKDPL